MRFFNWIFKITLGGIIFFTGVLNAQGWLVVGEWANNAIAIIPGIGLLSRLPLVGGWFQLAVGGLGMLMGICLWAAVQWIQVAPMLYADSSRLRELRTWAYVLEIIVCFARFSPYEGGYELFWDDFAAGALDLELFVWPNIGMACLSIILFELVIALGIEISKIVSTRRLPGKDGGGNAW